MKRYRVPFFAAVVAMAVGCSLATQGRFAVVAQQTPTVFATTVPVTQATSTPVPIPPSTMCRITNTVASGFTGNVTVQFQPGNSTVTSETFNLWSSNGGYVTTFTPSAAIGSFLVFPRGPGRLILWGQSGTGSSTERIDCHNMAVISPGNSPPPFQFDGSQNLLINANGTSVNVANAIVPLPVPTNLGVAPTPAAPVDAFMFCQSGLGASPAPAATGNLNYLQCDPNGAAYVRPSTGDPCADPSVPQLWAQLTWAASSTKQQFSSIVSGKAWHICSITVATAAAATFNLYVTTSSSCGATTQFATYPLSTGMVKTGLRELYPGQVPASDALCADWNGASATGSAEITFIKQ